MNRLVIIGALCFIIGTLQSSVQVICTDVGQGNCTLVLAQDPHVPLLIVDGGSLDYKFKGDTFKKDQLKSIATLLTNHAKKISNAECIVVVSHPDEDHYNWIIEIIAECKYFMPSFTVTHLYLGGNVARYSKKFRDWLDKLGKTSKPPTILLPADSVATTSVQDIYSNASIDLSYKLLPALPCTSDDEKNDASVVVQILFRGNSFLVTGDATKKTTDHILQYCPTLTTQFLLASHHGSSEEGCNDLSWIKKINPVCIIISSGVKIGHPHEDTFKVFMEALPDQPKRGHHLVAYGLSGKQKIRPQIVYEKDYGMHSTSKYLYGTLQHGTMTATLKADSSLSISRGTKSAGDQASSGLSILHGCLSTSPKVFSVNSVVSIDLSGLAVTDTDATQKEALINMLKKFKESGSPALRSLLLTDSTLTDQDSVDALVTLVQKNTTLRDLNLLRAPLPAGSQTSLTTAWNNRGLVFSESTLSKND